MQYNNCTMKARYSYRIYPTPTQARSLAKAFGCARVVWNDALAIVKSTPEGERWPSNGELQKLVITQAKRTVERAWLAEVSNIPLQQSVADLGIAFKNWFKSLKGQGKARYPRFKKRSNKQSIRFTRGGFSIKGRKLYLAKMGLFKVKWSRSLPSEPSSATVIKDASGRYFVSFVVDVEPELLPWNDKSIGVDLGMTTFATLDDGTKIDAPKPLKRNLKKLGRLQRRLAKCEKGSNRRKRAVLAVAKVHAQIKDIRTDFLHKLSSQLIRENQSISIEDLNVSGMMKNKKLARSIGDLGWRQFRTMLKAKADMYGRDVQVIGRWEPTSKTCSCCGEKTMKKRPGLEGLSIREWLCSNCGAFHDRDINAAKNIRVAGGQSETINGRQREHKTSLLAIPGDASNRKVVEQLGLAL